MNTLRFKTVITSLFSLQKLLFQFSLPLSVFKILFPFFPLPFSLSLSLFPTEHALPVFPCLLPFCSLFIVWVSHAHQSSEICKFMSITIPLSIMLLRYMQLLKDVSSLFFFLAEQYRIVCKNHTLLLMGFQAISKV